jgi:hypothetical protein
MPENLVKKLLRLNLDDFSGILGEVLAGFSMNWLTSPHANQKYTNIHKDSGILFRKKIRSTNVESDE